MYGSCKFSILQYVHFRQREQTHFKIGSDLLELRGEDKTIVRILSVTNVMVNLPDLRILLTSIKKNQISRPMKWVT